MSDETQALAKVDRLTAELKEAQREARELREARNAQGETCGRRMAEYGPWEQKEGLDGWNVRPNGDRTCTFCGSMHPDDVMRIAAACIDGTDGGVNMEVATGKRHKVYITQPGVRNASEGGIKFYGHHAPIGDAFASRLNAAIKATRRIE